VNELVTTWYQQLIEDLRKLEFEGIVITKWRIGKRILEDFKKFGNPGYGEHKLKDIADDMSVSFQEVYRCVQFAKKYPELSSTDESWSWEYVKRNLLPENPHFLSSSPKWNTPGTIINKTIQLFGSIDLDPCSNSHTDPNVPAGRYYTMDNDGLTQPWHGRVYMNPPYGNEIGNWTEKLRTEYEENRTTQGIALVPSRTDTEWFRNLGAYPRCFIWGRLKFSEYENSAPFPSMVVYLGKNMGGFVEIFRDMGDIYARVA